MADIWGTSGDDNLVGTSDDDSIVAGDGNDTVDGGEGNDNIDGGDGNDILRGGIGADDVFGWAGDDILYALGADNISAGDGSDTLTVVDGLGATFDGGANTDSLIMDFSTSFTGVQANLTYLFAGLSGSIGTATVSNFEVIAGTVGGSAFADTIVIGQFYSGSVTMDLGAGNDTAVGGAGADTIDGGAGSDNLSGGDGNDLLTDADGNGGLYGDSGDDIISLVAAVSGTADGGIGVDRLRFDLAGATSGVSVSLSLVGATVSGQVGGVSVAAFEGLDAVVNRTTELADTVTLNGSFSGLNLKTLGGNDVVTGGSGADLIDGGAGDDSLNGGAGADILIGGTGNDGYTVDNAGDTVTEAAGAGTDTVATALNSYNLAANVENLVMSAVGQSFGSGNELDNVMTLMTSSSSYLSGLNGNDTLNGSATADHLFGGEGNDIVNGAGGGDFLYGEGGNDTLNGGAGNDFLTDSLGTNTLNGGDDDDYIVIEGNSVTSADGGSGYDALDVWTTGRTTALAIDLTGMWSGGSGTVNGGTATGFESLIGLYGTAWDDVVNLGSGALADVGVNDAGAGNDTITGTDGDNYILGGDGNDILIGGGGSDQLLGGDGDDSITIGAGADDIVNGGAGTDILFFGDGTDGDTLEIDLTALWSGGTGTANGATISGIEVLGAIHGLDQLTPGVGDHVVIGAGCTAGVQIALGHGADIAVGGSGNDSIDGEQGDDELHGGLGNDYLSGSYASDVVYGDGGDDLIDGDNLDIEWAWGSDELHGGEGNDTIRGQAFDDHLYGDAGNDVLFGDGTIFLESHGDDTLEGGAGDDWLSGEGGSDTLQGGTGNDQLSGGTGDDTLAGGDGIDLASYAGASGAVRVSLLAGTSSGADGQDVISSVENLQGSAFGDALDGNSNANTLWGGAGADTLNGRGGADSLRGGEGNDTFYVDNGGDIVVEAADGGTDTVKSAVTYALRNNVENLTLFGSAAIDGAGNGANNIINGNAAANVLNGGAGADTMKGGNGNDTYVVDNVGDKALESSSAGGTDKVNSSVTFTLGANVENLTLTGTGTTVGRGNALTNQVTGNAANNSLFGFDGDDNLNGGAGNDQIYGGLGIDKLTGGTGADRFVFDSALSTGNHDNIADYNVADDTIVLDQSVFTAFGATGKVAASAFFIGTAAQDADDRVIYNSGNGNIYYDADGSGAGAQVLIAHVTAGLALTNADFLIVA